MNTKTFRSFWVVYATVLQLASGLAFGLMLFAPDSSTVDFVEFGLIAVVLLAGAIRSSFMRVVVSGEQIIIYGYLRNRRITMTNAYPEIINVKVFVATWAPVVVTSSGEEEDLSILAGYGRSQAPNKRVARVCAEMNRMVQEAQSR